jgi:hypothetical protein
MKSAAKLTGCSENNFFNAETRRKNQRNGHSENL